MLILILISLAMCRSLISKPVDTLPRSLPPGTSEEAMVTDRAPIIGYDCNRTDPEVLTMSALEVGPCPTLDKLLPEVELVYGQIIQRHNLHPNMVRTCQMTKSTFYFKCGKSWYNYQVYPPTIGQVIPIKPSICNNIHQTGSYIWSMSHPAWTNIETNTTQTRTVNEVGWTDKYGYCEGGVYDIAGTTHTDVVVQVSMTLSIRESLSVYDSTSGKINIENSLQCSYASGYCHDDMTGSHVWTPVQHRCPEETYVELYKGEINITSEKSTGLKLLSVNKPPFLFTAELGTKTFVCSLSLQLTEFPEVYFASQISHNYQGRFQRTGKNDIKFITYLNAKITFSYHELLNSVQAMFYAAMQRSCEIERDVLKNRIEIIRLTTNGGAFSTLLQGGMFAKANGEVIHVLKCEPVPVNLRNTETCFDALPILHKNQEKFLLPNTHIIAENASIIPCTPITPITYKIGGKWWSYTGTFQSVNSPQVISPRGIEKMEFTRIRSFSRGGMYSSDQIEAVQRMFSFPSLREAITTKIAAGLSSYYGKPLTMDVTNIMSETDMETIAQKNIKKMWGWFSSIGSTISGFIGIYFIYRVIRGAINTLFDAKELYTVFGFSFRLFAALWGRLALYLINQSRRMDNSTSPGHSDKGNSAGTSMDTRSSDRRMVAMYTRSVFAPTAPPREEEALVAEDSV